MVDLTKEGMAETSKMNIALEATHVKGESSGDFFKGKCIVRGYDFDRGVDHHELLKSFITNGFQSTLFARAVNEVNRMVRFTHFVKKTRI